MTGRQLRFAAAAILVVGLISAVWIYLAAAPSTADTLGYDPAQSKQYLRAMELYGGKANVLGTVRAWPTRWRARPRCSPAHSGLPRQPPRIESLSRTGQQDRKATSLPFA